MSTTESMPDPTPVDDESTPDPAPDNDQPTPDPAPDNDDRPSREEFSALTELVTTLADTVASLAAPRDEPPAKLPWTHRTWGR